ncbi:hypothetical protein HPB51_028352 [Rhipicephalus microplus]|uniref:DDE Tnp4 domain-containing protein n=1 Tax=Rhipicephalus microplus TaxID=6941 RepID=A0A9J6CXJ4_RHIMP|nr:hypothetical protein HPB51_028352 [Rhipicephalus microplus]
MSPATFDVLHSLVKEELYEGPMPSREPISSGERLALTLRLVNVSAPERFSDGGILQDSPIGERLHEGELSLPRAAMLPRSGRVCRHVFVGDEAFQLRPDFMRPLPGSRSVPAEVIYNYRLSRARRCVENAFGILVSRWRIYERQINLEPENVEAVVKATCMLHNFLSSRVLSVEGVVTSPIVLSLGIWRRAECHAPGSKLPAGIADLDAACPT